MGLMGLSPLRHSAWLASCIRFENVRHISLNAFCGHASKFAKDDTSRTRSPSSLLYQMAGVSFTSLRRPLQWDYTPRRSNSTAIPDHTSFPRQPIPFIPKKVLVINKLTLLTYESRKTLCKPFEILSDEEKKKLKGILEREGFNMAELVDSHEKQTASVTCILQALKDRKIDFTIVSPSVKESDRWEDFAKHGYFYRSTGSSGGLSAEIQARWAKESCLEAEARYESDEVHYNDESTVFAHNTCIFGHDLCITAGGDGTFLLGSLHNDGQVPVIGVNTSPGSSVGRLLCCTSEELDRLLDRLARGEYEWVKRHRIKIAIRPTGSKGPGRTLAQSALNEVFVGEQDPCRASLVRVSKDGVNWDQYKCSGLLISTVTGTTAWAAGVSALQPRDVMAVLATMCKLFGPDLAVDTLLKGGLDAARVAAEANALMISDAVNAGAASLQILAREPLLRPGAEKLPCIYKAGGGRPAYASTVEGGERLMIVALASQETQALLVLDGRVRVPMERGTEAVLQTCEDRVLWTFK